MLHLISIILMGVGCVFSFLAWREAKRAQELDGWILNQITDLYDDERG